MCNEREIFSHLWYINTSTFLYIFHCLCSRKGYLQYKVNNVIKLKLSEGIAKKKMESCSRHYLTLSYRFTAIQGLTTSHYLDTSILFNFDSGVPKWYYKIISATNNHLIRCTLLERRAVPRCICTLQIIMPVLVFAEVLFLLSIKVMGQMCCPFQHISTVMFTVQTFNRRRATYFSHLIPEWYTDSWQIKRKSWIMRVEK